MSITPIPSLEDVLGAFSVEAAHSKETLESYLKQYPQYAEELVDLSFELSRPTNEDDTPWTANELAQIDEVWQAHQKRTIQVPNPFEGQTVENLRHIATTLGVPRMVLAAFRERQVNILSVPKKFLARLAGALGQTVDAFMTFSQSTAPTPDLRSFKSDHKPEPVEQISFEKLLIQAEVSEASRQKLLSED